MMLENTNHCNVRLAKAYGIKHMYIVSNASLLSPATSRKIIDAFGQRGRGGTSPTAVRALADEHVYDPARASARSGGFHRPNNGVATILG